MADACGRVQRRPFAVRHLQVLPDRHGWLVGRLQLHTTIAHTARAAIVIVHATCAAIAHAAPAAPAAGMLPKLLKPPELGANSRTRGEVRVARARRHGGHDGAGCRQGATTA